MRTYETEAAWTHIIDQTGASYQQASEFLTAMSDYYAPQTSKPKDDRLIVEVKPSEYDFNKVLTFVFQATNLPLWMIAAMMTADVSYMTSIGILPAQATIDVKKWEAFHFDSLNLGEELGTAN
jgi:hypothetical protein